MLREIVPGMVFVYLGYICSSFVTYETKAKEQTFSSYCRYRSSDFSCFTNPNT